MNNWLNKLKFQAVRLNFRVWHESTFNLVFEDDPPEISWKKVSSLLKCFHMKKANFNHGNGSTLEFFGEDLVCKIDSNPQETENKIVDSGAVNAIRTFLATRLKVTPGNLDDFLRNN